MINTYKPKGFTTFSSHERGFTLVELLIAVAVIGVISAIGVSSYGGVREKAQDSVRKSDLQGIATALELYYAKHGGYLIDTVPCPKQSNVLYTSPDNIEFLKFVTGEIPKDPKLNTNYCYQTDETGDNFKLVAILDNNTAYELTSENYIAQATTPPAPGATTTPTSTATPACIPDGSCKDPGGIDISPACGQTVSGKDNCNNDCSRTGDACPPPPPFTQFDDPGSLPPSSQNPGSDACAWGGELISVLAYAYADPQYEANRWPTYGWSQVTSPRACFDGFDIKGTQPCGNNSDCNDGNSCTLDQCSNYGSGDEPIQYCNHSAGKFDCRAPMFGSCRADSDCNDNNTCTREYCAGNDDPEQGFVGHCVAVIKPGDVCGTASGRNKYCDFAGECRSDLCVSNSDCSDTNSCTVNDTCTITSSVMGTNGDGDPALISSFGVCGKTSQANYSVCEQSGPTISKLCGGGNQVNNTESTCTVDYVTCSDPTKTPATSGGACCGGLNVQGKLCQGECKLRPYPLYNDPAVSPPNTPLFGEQGIKNAVIRIRGDACGLSFINKTDSNGMVSFTIPRRVTSGRVGYTISADIPSGIQFTRGVCYNGKSYENPVNLVSQTAGTNNAECESGGFSGSNAVGFTSTFGFRPSAGTVQGIHSEPTSILQTIVTNIFNFIFGK